MIPFDILTLFRIVTVKMLVFSLKAKINDPTESPVSIFFNGPLDQIDVGSLTKMFEEATRSSILSNEFNSLFGDLAISSNAAIEGENTLGHDKPNPTTNTDQRIKQNSKMLNGGKAGLRGDGLLRKVFKRGGGCLEKINRADGNNILQRWR